MENESSEDLKPKAKPRKKAAPKKKDGAEGVAAVSKKAEKKAKKGPPAEKRIKRYRPSCPKSLHDRWERAATQRLYLIQQSEIPVHESVVDESTAVDFTVLGSTGNVYTVSLGLLPTCTCPDFSRRQDTCKHIMFVLLKVAGLGLDNPLAYQKAYISTELKELFGILRLRRVGGSSVLANARVRAAVASAQGTSIDSSNDTAANEADDANGGVQRRSLQEGEDNDCPICFDDLAQEPEHKLTYCRGTCGTNFHAACITRWFSAGNSAHKNCPNCRQVWIIDSQQATTSGGANSSGADEEGYLNVASLQGLSRERDTSTYYKRERYRYW
jgi:Ring finger domain/SWIM zinc finger